MANDMRLASSFQLSMGASNGCIFLAITTVAMIVQFVYFTIKDIHITGASFELFEFLMPKGFPLPKKLFTTGGITTLIAIIGSQKIWIDLNFNELKQNSFRPRWSLDGFQEWSAVCRIFVHSPLCGLLAFMYLPYVRYLLFIRPISLWVIDQFTSAFLRF